MACSAHERFFVETVLDARIRNGVKYRQWAADAQDLVAEQNPDRRWPQTENLVHREIMIKRAMMHKVLPSRSGSPANIARERGRVLCDKANTTRDYPQLRIGEFAVNNMEIGPAYAAGGDTEADFARTGKQHRLHWAYTGPTATT